MSLLWRVSAGLLLPFVPSMAVFGNILVMMAVYRERSLQTVTNMLIVSLAVSDFLVAICVMSFGVYYEWNGFKWDIGPFLCNVYLASDVTCSTASILNLLAISLDRYIAISHPISYAQYGSRGGRSMVSITIVWGVSTAVGLPILFGVNPMESDQCELANPYFNILSSLFSFFIPCLAMILLYAVIFRRLRQRERARSLRLAAKNENTKISSALLGGARMARQMGKHFKDKTDQILLEISFQTSSYPTMSDSSDDISTMTQMGPLEVNFGPTTVISTRLKPAASAPNIAALEPTTPLLNGTVHNSVADNPKCLELLNDITDQLQQFDQNYPALTRSFGDDLEELLPFIDSGSKKGSREELHHVRRAAGQATTTPLTVPNATPSTTPTTTKNTLEPTRAELKSISIASMKDERIMAQMERERVFGKKCSLRDGIVVSESFRKKVTDLLSLPHMQRNGKLFDHDKNGTMGEKTLRLFDVFTNNEYTFCDSLRVYKSQLWKRVTTGWKTRPSRQLVKKATKQMRREHKATVTLAVVLAVFLFCWLPFFSLHLANSICHLRVPNADEAQCLPAISLFLATWLGYINSSLNPLIYTVFDQRFRSAFRSILSCGSAKK